MKLYKIAVNFYSFFRNIQKHDKKVSSWTSIEFPGYLRASIPSPALMIQIYIGTRQNWDKVTPFTLAFTVFAICSAVRSTETDFYTEV